jgi:hypothetical protein
VFERMASSHRYQTPAPTSTISFVRGLFTPNML